MDLVSGKTIFWKLILILSVAIAVRIYFFAGIMGSDDASLAGIALAILEDGFSVPQGHYAARIGLTLPLVLVFKIFGVGEWQMAVLPLILSSIGIWLAFAIGSRLQDATMGLLAALLLAMFPLDVLQATSYFPDLPLGVLLGASFYLAIGHETENRVEWSAVASGLIWGYAYLIKIEAFFLGFVYLAMFIFEPSWRKRIAVICITCLAIVFAENIYYFLHTDAFLYRLQIISGIGGKVTEEYSESQLWVFPKSWFITFYNFGIYYYLFFIGLIYFIVCHRKTLYPVVIWSIVYLLWLQFGGNPFSGSFSVKSHLVRYCEMVAIPMSVIIAALLMDMRKRYGSRISGTVIAGTLAVSLFFISFNSLSVEREHATKLALDYADKNDLFPLYMDKASFDIAELLLHSSKNLKSIRSLQIHDFGTGQTRLISIDEISGYILLNKQFMRYKERRYSMSPIDINKVKEKYKIILSISNPMPSVSYLQARLLSYLAGFLPSQFLRDKIRNTSDELLEDEDVLIFHKPN